MRGLLVDALCLAWLASLGCGDDLETGFGAPVGAHCFERVEPLCAGGDGACVASTCVRQCSGSWPACPGGLPASWVETPLAGRVCTCP